jgi:hypothetical protein
MREAAHASHAAATVVGGAGSTNANSGTRPAANSPATMSRRMRASRAVAKLPP